MGKANTEGKTGRKTNSARARVYAMDRALNPNRPKKVSMQIAGYSPNLMPCTIERTKSYQSAIEELQAIAAECKCTPKDQLSFFQQTRDDRKVVVTSRIESGKEINRMLGYHAPQQVQVEQHTTQHVALLLGMVRREGVPLGELIRQAQAPDMDSDMDSVPQAQVVSDDIS